MPVERYGRAQERRRIGRFPDVVQLGGQTNPLRLGLGLTERFGQRAGELGDAFDVQVERGVLFGDDLQQYVGDLSARRLAAGVAEDVVGSLETVQVEDHQQQLPTPSWEGVRSRLAAAVPEQG